MATGNYTTHLKVRRLSGHEQTIVLGESLGTGDGSTTVFYTANYPIVDRSADEVADKTDVTVYVDGGSVTISSIVADEGKITLESAPGNSTAVTADYNYSDVSENTIKDAVLYGESELEGLVGRVFTNANSQTDYFDGDGIKKTFQLRKYPVQGSITTVKIREPGKTSWETQTLADGDGIDDDYWAYIMDGKSYIIFTDAPYSGNQNIEIVYNYGYSSVPYGIEYLASCLAALYVHVVVDAGWSIQAYRLVEQEVRFGGRSPHDAAMLQLIEAINNQLKVYGRKKLIGIIR